MCIFLFACIENLINIIWQYFVFCWLARSHVFQQGQSWVDDDERADWEEMNLLWWPNHYNTIWGWSWWQHHWKMVEEDKKIGQGLMIWVQDKFAASCSIAHRAMLVNGGLIILSCVLASVFICNKLCGLISAWWVISSYIMCTCYHYGQWIEMQPVVYILQDRESALQMQGGLQSTYRVVLSLLSDFLATRQG